MNVVEVLDRRAMRTFIAVANDLNRGDPSWIAPLWMERHKALDRRRNPYFKHAEAAFWIATRDGRAVGRISAQVDRLWNVTAPGPVTSACSTPSMTSR
jgi:hypothetical protein